MPHPDKAAHPAVRATWKLISRTRIASAAILAAVAATSVAVPAAQATATATTWYVNCASTAAAANGTLEAPWKTVASINAHTFTAGDSLKFRKGSTCTGGVAPRGSGSLASPITVGAYGEGAAPVVNGAGTHAAFTLMNQDHWTIADLTLTNPAPTLARRNGLYIAANDGTAHRGYLVKNLTIDDVAGQTNKNGATSGDFAHSAGIEFEALNNGTTLNQVTVESNQVSNTGGGGIKVRVSPSSSTLRGENILIQRNVITSAGGDGIIASFANAPLIQYNTANNLGGGKYPWTGGNFAGMWALGSVNPVIQKNVVYGSQRDDGDAMAYDCDWGITGTCLIQYNYSHDNYGGFYLNCDGCNGISTLAPTQIVRYNIFQNDCRAVTSGAGTSAKLEFYNNTVYCPNKKFDIKWPPNSKIWNNIFVGTADSVLPTGPDIDYQWNIFQGVPRPTANGIVGDPGLVNPGTGGNSILGLDGYALKATSRGINSGVLIPNNGGRDYFGNPVSASTPPNRGAYNGPGK